jgi:tetratricopeptide (TPR) repeat protein
MTFGRESWVFCVAAAMALAVPDPAPAQDVKQAAASVVERLDLAFDAALAAALAGSEADYRKQSAIVSELAGPESSLPGDLALERGLAEAAQSAPGALDHIETFIRLFPLHPRQTEARIALAELYLTQVPPQPVAARENLDAARTLPLTLERREWLDHVAIWVEIGAQDRAGIVKSANRFLEDWPQSIRRPGVLMVLGENFFREGDHERAKAYFERVAEESPASELAEPALFFAARSASLIPGQESQQLAYDLWSRVATGSGPLAVPALHEAALLDLARERHDEAIAALERVAAAPNADAALRVAARADRGEALFAKATALANDAALLEQAATAFAEIGSDPAAARVWRLQAAVRQGKCLEALGRSLEALEIYRRVVTQSAPSGPAAVVPVAEFDWFYRAGLAAIQLLQQSAQWREAVAIADWVAQAGGPRAAEAARLAGSLRLRHFIWEEPGKAP